MKKLITTIMLLLALPLAQAAENKDYSWEGFYVGAHGGGVRFDSDYSDNIQSTSAHSSKINEFIGGGLVGYNYQDDDLVLGVEADISGGDFKKGPQPGGEAGGLCYYCNQEVNYTSHLRLKLGKAFGNTLLFAAGGLSLADVEFKDSEYNKKDDNTHVGWNIGAGVDHAINKNVIIRAEYIYDDFGSEDYKINGVTAYTSKIDLTSNTGRLAAIYKF